MPDTIKIYYPDGIELEKLISKIVKKSSTETQCKKPMDIEKIVEKTIEKTINTYKSYKKEVTNYFKQTEKRLYAYSDLVDNIEKYNNDIEDLKKEKFTTKSKDIVFIPAGGTRLDPDDIQEAKILNIKNRRDRDQAEVDEINWALDSVRNDDYYMVIEHKYFNNKSDVEIGAILHCDERTVRRHKNRLVQKIAVKLYGSVVNS